MNRSLVDRFMALNRRYLFTAAFATCIFLFYLVVRPASVAIVKAPMQGSFGSKIAYYDAFIPGSDNIIKVKPPVERDLAMQLLAESGPERVFHEYIDQPPINIGQLSVDKKVFSTMFCSRRPHPRDPYFAATQQLIWRILWSPFASKHPIVVFVCPFVSAEYRAVFKGQGAIVRELPLLDILPEEKIGTKRWTDQFVKLNLWNQTEFQTIVYLDSDAFPLANIDDIFDVAKEQSCLKDQLEVTDSYFKEQCNYLFAGVPMPINGVELVNGGLLVLKPDAVLFERLLHNARRHTEYDISTMEQSFLNSQLAFGKTSPFPAQHLTYIYNAGADKYAEIESGTLDPTTIRVLHEKIWIHRLAINTSPKLALWRDRWLLDWMHMIRFYNDPLWEQMRKIGRKPRDEEERKQWMAEAGEEPFSYAQDWWSGGSERAQPT